MVGRVRDPESGGVKRTYRPALSHFHLENSPGFCHSYCLRLESDGAYEVTSYEEFGALVKN